MATTWNVSTEDRLKHLELLRRALTTGPVSTFQVCCGNMSLLSYAADRLLPLGCLEFLVDNTRFRQEDGCRIIDFIEHLGNVIVGFMYGYRSGHLFNGEPAEFGKKSLCLLLRAGTQNRFAREHWYVGGLYRTWVLGVFNAASTSERYPNLFAEDQPLEGLVVPVPLLLGLADCIIDMFPDEDASFWSEMLKILWTHSRITGGTLRRVADKTLQLLDLGASTQIDLPSGSLIARILSLGTCDHVDPGVDDFETRIGNDDVMMYDFSSMSAVVDRDMLWEKRAENIERLQKRILGLDGRSPSWDTQEANIDGIII
ncbi:hypothetical protein LX36DRAFT_437237 [Colletotrichum falcatum]|nr:hypothetical protein LX36DRAFT_437237 [Colletotrichum falcatum]